jgi:predicted RNA binding protein YcfA (HicA-like mRNA interferase family)
MLGSFRKKLTQWAQFRHNCFDFNILTNGTICGTVIVEGFILGRFDKLLNKALSSPQNLRFEEFCSLIEYFGAKRRKTEGSHRIYKREKEPTFTQSVQDVGGKAKEI